MTPEITSGKEKAQGKLLIPDLLDDDLTFPSPFNDVEPFNCSGSLLKFPKGQKLSLLEDFTGAEKQDGFSPACDLFSFPRSVPENMPSEGAGCTTRHPFSLDSLLHEDDVPEPILSGRRALSLVPSRTCNPEALPILYLEHSRLQHVQKSGSFENLNKGEIKNIEKETSTEMNKSWGPKLSDCIDFDSDWDTLGCEANIPAPERPAPGIEQSDVTKEEADALQTQEQKVPDMLETLGLLPSSP